MRSPRLVVFLAAVFIGVALAQTSRSGRVGNPTPSFPLTPNAFGWQSGVLVNGAAFRNEVSPSRDPSGGAPGSVAIQIQIRAPLLRQ